MLCDDCKQQPAVVHITQIVNGQKLEFHLCLTCANRRSIQIWPLPSSPQAGIAAAMTSPPMNLPTNRKCQHCGLDWGEFMSTGFLGCTRCYQSFGDLLAQVISKNQGAVRHQGKYPAKGGGPLRIRREI